LTHVLLIFEDGEMVMKTRKWALKAVGIAVLLACIQSGALADVDSEREELARISHELTRLQGAVANASKNAATGQRVRFRYDWLARDLDLMRQGVEAHLDAPMQPRSVPALKHDYRQ
jgi:RAQPRD family integrative conjugative element protein